MVRIFQFGYGLMTGGVDGGHSGLIAVNLRRAFVRLEPIWRKIRRRSQEKINRSSLAWWVQQERLT
jgi:hypothetical protein